MNLLADIIPTSMTCGGCAVNLPSFDRETLQLPKQASDPSPSDK